MKRLNVLGSPFSPVRLDTHFSRNSGVYSENSEQAARIFSAVQTAWRSTQSRANCSPAKIPSEQGKYRDFSRVLLSTTPSAFRVNLQRKEIGCFGCWYI